MALNSHGITQSMSRKGNCCDKAPMESFFGTMKTELVHHRSHATREDAKRDLLACIEVYHNRQRLHSAVGDKNPGAGRASGRMTRCRFVRETSVAAAG